VANRLAPILMTLNNVEGCSPIASLHEYFLYSCSVFDKNSTDIVLTLSVCIT